MDSETIVKVPHPTLRTVAQPLENPDNLPEAIFWRIMNMLQVMEGAKGIGLAAPQINWPVRVFVMNVTGLESDNYIFINPGVELSGKIINSIEGCLSIPEINGVVLRNESVVVKAYGINGKPFTETFHGLEARCIQHEYDHLCGILFTDKVVQ